MSSLMLAGALNLEETYGWGGLSSTRRSRNQSSAGFLTCCVADFPVGMIWKVRGIGGLGNPRYSRLGSLRYGKKSSQPESKLAYCTSTRRPRAARRDGLAPPHGSRRGVILVPSWSLDNPNNRKNQHR